MSLRVGTDCSGIDSPLLALKHLNIPFNYIFASELDRHLRKNIINTYNPELIFNDITTRKHYLLPQVDLYICGFPCQTFSSLGNLGGLNKSPIFYHCIETIKYTKPKYFILENVKNIITHDFGNTFNIIKDNLEMLDYNIYIETINSKYFTPQDRTRVYFIGIQKNIDNKLCIFNDYDKDIKNINDILNPNIKYIDILNDKLDNIIVELELEKDINYVFNIGVSKANYCNVKINLSPTLTTKCNKYYIYLKKRFLTVSELQALQGLEDLDLSFLKISNQYKAIGNSMTRQVIEYILKKLLL